MQTQLLEIDNDINNKKEILKTIKKLSIFLVEFTNSCEL